ncbi:MAG: hypothetical protein QOJ65_1639 [Fimbriimonadaceae bacterium]|nr:hypothetical protein [Fimbriimonadaceae bacterium]
MSVVEPVEDRATRPDPSLPGGYWTFLGALGALAGISIVLGHVALGSTLKLSLAVLFFSLLVLAEFFGANSRWKVSHALYFLLGGILIQGVFGVLTGNTVGSVSGISNAISQMGLAMWCVGLGALLGLGLRDKNLLIPVSIFGAAFDIYLVLTPAGITNQVMKAAPKVFTSVAAQVPVASSQAPTGKAEVLTYIGPADLLFLAAFFVVLFKFQMNARRTLALMIPVLVLYMLAVLMFNIALPALVPIGACVLIANWSYFKLSRDEWMATGVVAALCVGLIMWSMSRRKPEPETLAEPSPRAAAPAAPGSAAKPGPGGSGLHRSASPNAPGNK